MVQEITKLDADPMWKAFKASDLGKEASKAWTLAQLLGYRVESSFAIEIPESSAKESLESHDKSERDPRLPTAPNAVGISKRVLIGPLHSLAEMLEKLGDGDLLAQARHYSFRYNRAIFKWGNLLFQLVRGSIETSEQDFNRYRSKESYYVPTYSRDILLNNLTLPEIRTLIIFEMPRSSDIDDFYKDNAKVTLPWIGMPLGLASGTLFVEIGLLISTIYFWLYYREAQLSNNFPAKGTLFGVFFRTRFSIIMFELFVAIPAIAASLLAFRSFWITPVNAFLAVLVLLAVCLIQFQPRAASST